ncbi:MAG: NAD(P)/FAD-dependent oxidoreductase [Vicinamibacterales bacterium]
MRIAIVGAGISGLSAAFVLSRAHEVTLFEREPRLGGHAHTHDVAVGGRPLAVDTGFMVFNARTYPNFLTLLASLGVESRASDMSFGVRCRRCGLEYSSLGPAGLFAQPRRALDPRHWTMLADVARFFRAGQDALVDGSAEGLSLGAFLDRHGFGPGLVRHFILPMGGAIWSASSADMRAFPALSFLRFFDNHGLLAATGQPTWRTVAGGSRAYVQAIARRLDGAVRAGLPVARILRDADGVAVRTVNGETTRHDHVVIATHADEALALLGDPSDAEREALGRFRYSTNDTWLHTDASLLPRARGARASWNCDLADCEADGAPVSVTYDLSRLQGLGDEPRVLCSLNPVAPVGGEVLARMTYTHPILDRAAFEGQALVARLNGQRRTHYCGAHLRYGFHEDGLVSALAVTRAFGLDL